MFLAIIFVLVSVKAIGYEKYHSTITHEEPAAEGARRKILDYEKKRADQVRSQLDEARYKRP